MVTVKSSSASNILFLLTEQDKPYVPRLNSALASAGASGGKNIVSYYKLQMRSEVSMLCTRSKCSVIVTTQEDILPKIIQSNSTKKQKLDDYAGSFLKVPDTDIWILFIPPLKQVITKNYGQFLLERYLSKITAPHKWVDTDSFSYSLLVDMNIDIASAVLCAVDIETRKDLSISSVSFTMLYPNMTTHSFVLPLPYGLTVAEYEYRYEILRQLCDTSIPKVFQNGKYDIAYLNRYGCPVRAYLFDTMVCHHCWYSELPKELGTLAAFYLREVIFWKNEGEGSEENLYLYNALDTWHTLWVFIAWLQEAPDWAKKNFLIEMPIVFPSILCEATGIYISEGILEEQRNKNQEAADMVLSDLRESIGVPAYNPKSPPQTMSLLRILGCKDLPSTEEKYLKQAAFRHPFNAWIIDRLIEYRKLGKLISTYLVPDKLFQGRMLYSLIPYGTATGRLSSSEHPFWLGANIQNIPRGSGIKKMYIADAGFLIGETDYAQAESRDTGYISGDTVLIAAVDGENDFHSFNASSFFGVPYEVICRNEVQPDGTIKHKVLDKELRQLSKPVNHGKNYNMGSKTLVETMGLESILRAGARLGLVRKGFGAVQIADYLGAKFAATYSILTGRYYRWVENTVSTLHLLTGATGWTRYCFGNPKVNKRELNEYIAHAPQSLNAMTLNKAVMRVFREVWMKHPQDFKLCAQVHDSILYQIRIGKEKVLQAEVERCMIIPTPVTDIFGIERVLTVPVDSSKMAESWYECKSD